VCPSLFSKAAREFQFIHQQIGKKELKICKGNQPMGKGDKSADTLACFENSNEIQKLDEYPV